MRNFGAPTYNSPTESVKSMIPAWLTWKTALAIFAVRAVSTHVIYNQSVDLFKAQGSSSRAARAKAAGTAGVLSTVLTIPVGYVIATRAEEEAEIA